MSVTEIGSGGGRKRKDKKKREGWKVKESRIGRYNEKCVWKREGWRNKMRKREFHEERKA